MHASTYGPPPPLVGSAKAQVCLKIDHKFSKLHLHVIKSNENRNLQLKCCMQFNPPCMQAKPTCMQAKITDL